MKLRKPFADFATQQAAEMRSFGIEPVRARKIAIWEAEGRQRMARKWGDEHALTASLVWQDEPDGSTRWFFMHPCTPPIWGIDEHGRHYNIREVPTRG